MKPELTALDFNRAADALGCTVAEIKAVCQVEAPLGGFQADYRPTILFERHKFSEFTAGAFDRDYPDLSNRKPGGYGLYSQQHDRLARAAKLDRVAALKATSWGKFQIMGFNHVQAGFDLLQLFINAMYRSEGAQLDAFVSYVRNDRRKHPASGRTMRECLILHDWDGFARLYNGPSYQINNYATKLAAAHRDARMIA